MGLIRCVDCKHFVPDPASLREGQCSHPHPWDGDKMQSARDEHLCGNFDSHGGKRHISAKEAEELKKFPGLRFSANAWIVRPACGGLWPFFSLWAEMPKIFK